MQELKTYLIVIILLGLSLSFRTYESKPKSQIIFWDTFSDTSSYFPEVTLNATCKEYEGCNHAGYLPKKWLYNWTYTYEGDWRQAFYCIPEGKNYLEQSGRAACKIGDMRIIANANIPEDIQKYSIDFKQYKHDNDPIYYILGGDSSGHQGLEIGFQNQLPQTDSTIQDAFLLGHYKNGTRVNMSKNWRRWMPIHIEVDFDKKRITWLMDGQVVLHENLNQFVQGGYFGIRQCYDRGTRFDDFKITIWK